MNKEEIIRNIKKSKEYISSKDVLNVSKMLNVSQSSVQKVLYGKTIYSKAISPILADLGIKKMKIAEEKVNEIINKKK